MNASRPCARFLAAALVTLAFAAALPVRAADAAAVPAPTLEHAHGDYAAGRYRPAFEAYARLADAGDVEAARIATLMVRHGAELYGEPISVPVERVRLWRALLESAAKARIGTPD